MCEVLLSPEQVHLVQVMHQVTYEPAAVGAASHGALPLPQWCIAAL